MDTKAIIKRAVDEGKKTSELLKVRHEEQLKNQEIMKVKKQAERQKEHDEYKKILSDAESILLNELQIIAETANLALLGPECRLDKTCGKKFLVDGERLKLNWHDGGDYYLSSFEEVSETEYRGGDETATTVYNKYPSWNAYRIAGGPNKIVVGEVGVVVTKKGAFYAFTKKLNQGAFDFDVLYSVDEVIERFGENIKDAYTNNYFNN